MMTKIIHISRSHLTFTFSRTCSMVKVFIFALFLLPILSFAEIWGNTEIQLQALGEFELPGTGGTAENTILTFQHAGPWEYGDNFFFIDYTRVAVNDDANFPVADKSEFYGEWYSTFSLGKITGKSFNYGIIKDVGIVGGVNFAPEVESMWVLPGIKLSLDLPGFTFASVNMTAYIHQQGGDINSPVFTVVDQSSSYMVDFGWSYPFTVDDSLWNIEGHLEYMKGRNQTSNISQSKLASWLLFQPQIRLDVGNLLGGKNGRIFAGIEYQYWKNKLGEKGTDDNTVQFLAVWRF